jgi:Uma2 family endonuclease
MYIMPSMPSNAHQFLVGDLDGVFREVVKKLGLGQSYPGANVSDRRKGWEYNNRVPDLLVVLKNSRAIDCDTHFCGGPDFLIEIQSPGDDTEENVPCYAKIGVSELLVIHRDHRTLRLLRLEGGELVLAKPTLREGKEWLVSAVLPLAFRRTTSKGTPRTQVQRTDGKLGQWTV